MTPEDPMLLETVVKAVRRDADAHRWLLTWIRDGAPVESALTTAAALDVFHRWNGPAWREAILEAPVRLALNGRAEIASIAPADPGAR